MSQKTLINKDIMKRKSYTPEEIIQKHELDYQKRREININWRLNHPEQYILFKNNMKNYYQENKERLNALRTERRRQKRQEEERVVQLVFV